VITNTSENFTDVGKALVYLGKEQAVLVAMQLFSIQIALLLGNTFPISRKLILLQMRKLNTPRELK
ncbi:hypothetical protein, partial [Escherichia albertii]|uniref:hypothetical protein n=1 Tax=Escherichia albertii TaxID=208962 RepID=UPI001A8E34C9